MNDPHDTTAGASGTTWVYTYDRGGNILSKSYYAYTTGTPGTAVDTIAYSYTDSNWKDKLTSYDGNEITYDAIGNPLSDGTWTYTWEKGRQLKQMSKSGMNVEFKYDHNGLRTQKKVTSDGEVTVTDYTLHGKLVTHLTRGSDEMHFFYDAQSRPAMVDFNGALYSYVHNLQGDVVGIVDSAGSLVVEYKYDAWGKPTLVRTLTAAYEALAELNPFRYRGYVFDEETGLHYLKARYYCSSWHRFLNPDAAIYDSKRIGESNLYTYCSNRPVVFYDPTGESIKAAIMAFIARWLAKFIGMIFGGQDGDKEYNNSYDPEDTDPTKPRKTTVEKIKEENPLLKNASATGEYRGIIEYTAREKNMVGHVEYGVRQLIMTFLDKAVFGLGILGELIRGLTIDATERNPGFYHCIEYTFTNEIIDYGSDGEIINSKKETWTYYEYFGVNDLTYYVEFGEYSYIENYM